MSAPAVSIVVPVYNTGSFLPRCLASLERQTFQDKEVILVDDGSTDGSAALCDAFAQRHPWARVLRHVRTEGLSAARNDGVAATIGEFIGFVDSDDWIAPTMFETLHRVATETESDVAQIQYVLCSGERQVDNPNECVRTLTAEEALAEMLFDERYAVCSTHAAPSAFPSARRVRTVSPTSSFFRMQNKLPFRIASNTSTSKISEASRTAVSTGGVSISSRRIASWSNLRVRSAATAC